MWEGGHRCCCCWRFRGPPPSRVTIAGFVLQTRRQQSIVAVGLGWLDSIWLSYEGYAYFLHISGCFWERAFLDPSWHYWRFPLLGDHLLQVSIETGVVACLRLSAGVCASWSGGCLDSWGEGMGKFPPHVLVSHLPSCRDDALPGVTCLIFLFQSRFLSISLLVLCCVGFSGL